MTAMLLCNLQFSRCCCCIFVIEQMFWRVLLGRSQSCDHALWHEKFWALLNMMGGAVMFGPVVGQVCYAGPPEETELVLGFAASQPVKWHVNCLGLPWLNIASDL
jgi:hypothetical protein